MPELTRELFGHLNRASESLTEARGFLDLADTSDPVVAGDVAQLKPRIAVVGEMVALAKPVAQLAAQHVDSARRASQDVTPPALLEPVTLERSIATAGKELGRADEDVRLLGDVVDHAATSARQSAGIASRDLRQRPPPDVRARPGPGPQRERRPPRRRPGRRVGERAPSCGRRPRVAR